MCDEGPALSNLFLGQGEHYKLSFSHKYTGCYLGKRFIADTSFVYRPEEMALQVVTVGFFLTRELIGVSRGRRLTTLRLHACLLIQGAFENNG